MQGRELVKADRDAGCHEVFFHELGMLLHCLIAVQEDHAFLFPFFLELMVDDVCLVLRANSCESFLFRFRDAKLFVGLPDVCGHILPALRVSLRIRPHEEVNLVEIEILEAWPPIGQGHLIEALQPLKPFPEHPFRLIFLARDLPNKIFRDARPGLEREPLRIDMVVRLAVDFKTFVECL